MEVQVYLLDEGAIHSNEMMNEKVLPERREVTLTINMNSIIGYHIDMAKQEINFFINGEGFVSPYSEKLEKHLKRLSKDW